MADAEGTSRSGLPSLRRRVATADGWIAHLRLAPIPGGYFRRGYTAELTLDLPDRTRPRPVATAIFYLLKGDQHSACID